MLFHLREIIYEAFFRIGYKLGSLIGYVGGSSLGNGFEKGLAKRIEESVEKFTDTNDFNEIIRHSLDRIIEDFFNDSLGGDFEVHHAVNELANTDFTEDPTWVEHADNEVQHIIDNMEANQP